MPLYVPILVRSTRNAGKIKIKAEVQFPGTHAPTPAEIEFESLPADLPMCLIEQQTTKNAVQKTAKAAKGSDLTEEQKAKLLKEVEQQQADFGIQK